MSGLFGDIGTNLSLAAGESIRRNAGDSAFEAFTALSGTSGVTAGTYYGPFTATIDANGRTTAASKVFAILLSFYATAPTGYVLLQGGTIGDGSSGGTARANADTADLFAHLWNNLADAQAAVSSGRGASAAADFAAHKTITLPNLRQRFPIGLASSGTGSTLGGTGGTVDHTHSVPAHYHAMGTGADLNITSSGAHTHTVAAYSGATVGTSGLTHRAGAADNVTKTSSSDSHTHASGNFAGKIGLVTGGVDGNAAMTSGTGNPPFLAVNFIINL